QELLHQIRGTGALRTEPDGGPAKIGKGVKGTAGSAKQQQGLRRREPAKELEPRLGWHRRAVLDEGEHVAAAARIGGEPAYVLDRARGRYRREGAMLASGPLGEAPGQRVILSSGRARQNRCVQVAVIASDAEGRSHGRDQRGDDDEEDSAGNHFAAPEGR